MRRSTGGSLLVQRLTGCMLIIAALFVVFPILVVLMNSFKSRLFIATEPFSLPSLAADKPTFVGLLNYHKRHQ